MKTFNQNLASINNEIEEKQALKNALEKAIPLQVHRKTDYPPVNDQLAGIYSELVQLRKAHNRQIRKAERVKKHLDVIILDLWIAANYSESPWRRMLKNTNIPDLRFHDLRHEACSRFFERGFNVMETAHISGHKTLQQLKRYTHLKAEDIVHKMNSQG